MVKSAFANVVNAVLSFAVQELRAWEPKGNPRYRLEQVERGPVVRLEGIRASTWEG
jgi:hypothetical protein